MFASALGRTRDSITDESHGRQAETVRDQRVPQAGLHKRRRE